MEVSSQAPPTARLEVFAQFGKLPSPKIAIPVVLRASATMATHSMFIKNPVTACIVRVKQELRIIAMFSLATVMNVPCLSLGGGHMRKQ